MAARLVLESTLTSRYQTTVPSGVRKALGLSKHDKLFYELRPDGKVLLSRAPDDDGHDPLLGKFLSFLAQELEDHPERIQPVSAALVTRVQSLVDGVRIDLDARLADDDE